MRVIAFLCTLAQVATLVVACSGDNPVERGIEAYFRWNIREARRICSALGYDPDCSETKTVTSKTSTTLTQTVTSGVTVITQESGTVTTSITSTTVDPTTIIFTDTLIESSTSDMVESTTTFTSTVTTTMVVDTTTSTTSSFVNVWVPEPTDFVPVEKRSAESKKLSLVIPNCPESLRDTLVQDVLGACRCVFPPEPPKTTTVVVTSTVTSYQTVESTSTAVVPLTTTTVVIVDVSPTTVSDTTTVTDLIVVTSPITSSTTTTTTMTVTSTPTAIVTAIVTTQYTKNFEDVGPPARIYNEYYSNDFISRADTNRPLEATECADECAADTECQFYDFIVNTDGETAAYCLLDSNPYNPSFDQSVSFLQYALAYTKISQTITTT